MRKGTGKSADNWCNRVRRIALLFRHIKFYEKYHFIKTSQEAKGSRDQDRQTE